MKIDQKLWTSGDGWKETRSGSLSGDANLVFVFGGKDAIKNKERFDEVGGFYKNAHIVSCSTAGEILDTRVTDESISLTAVKFSKTKVRSAVTNIESIDQSNEKGREVAGGLEKDDLVHCMVFSDGLKVNGTGLVEGIMSVLPKNVRVTGGLVGDGANFKETVLGLDQVPESGKIVLIGFYGNGLRVGHGSLGGWDTFGPERKITKSKGSVLYELDDKPALDLYKEYLGDQADGLPGTGLLFPLSLRRDSSADEHEVVRTLLAVDEEAKSMTFAGDMPQGASARLMKANFDRLVDGASGAAKMSARDSSLSSPELAILISCVGRKLVLKDRIEEETEAVKRVLGEGVAMAGFYSYGEISPTSATEQQCRLHNQTMTITTFKEE